MAGLTRLRRESAIRLAAAARVPSGRDHSAEILNLLPAPVLLIGPDGRIETANPAARSFLGLGGEGGQLSAALRQPQVLEAVGAALRGERPEPVEYSTPAPVESHIRAIATPLRPGAADARDWRAVLVFVDETSIKRIERMRADFLANASHELRTPLASLAGFIETLRGHAKGDQAAQERFLGIMQDQTERMRRLIDDLLSLSRIEMDEHLPPGGKADLSKLAGDIVDALAPLADEKNVTVRVDAGGPARVTGDRDQLLEVAQNLLENAIKYSPSGAEVLIEVRAGLSREAAEKLASPLSPDASRLAIASPPGASGRRYAAMQVRDSGPGIDRRHLPRLSERFYRVDGQKSGPREGTGLGLAIVKHIVNRHRGGLVVESAPGAGSVFTAYFPEYVKPDATPEAAVR
ncbi:MAG: histidine kinase [Maricaulaceae bacterium]|nr:histidine kinase [Maricaulaceae bacterium]